MEDPCIWQNFEQIDYQFCETQICGLITQPANTWSNIGYLIVAFFIRKFPAPPRIKTLYFWSTLCLGIGSAIFHATSTYWGKFLDVSAMFFLSMAILSIAVERRFSLSRMRSNLFFTVGLLFSITFLYFMRFGHVLFASQIFASAFLEWKMARTSEGLNFKRMKIAMMVLITAFLIWILDVMKILCIPGNHILTGHGVWHLLTAATIWIFFKSYSLKRTSI